MVGLPSKMARLTCLLLIVHYALVCEKRHGAWSCLSIAQVECVASNAPPNKKYDATSSVHNVVNRVVKGRVKCRKKRSNEEVGLGTR